jgi:hypothetical protein
VEWLAPTNAADAAKNRCGTPPHLGNTVRNGAVSGPHTECALSSLAAYQIFCLVRVPIGADRDPTQRAISNGRSEIQPASLLGSRFVIRRGRLALTHFRCRWARFGEYTLIRDTRHGTPAPSVLVARRPSDRCRRYRGGSHCDHRPMHYETLDSLKTHLGAFITACNSNPHG